MKKNKFFVLGVLAVLLTFGVAQQLSAQTGTWDVSVDGKWSDGHNIASLKDMVKQGALKRDSIVYSKENKVYNSLAGLTELASLFPPFTIPKGFVGTWNAEMEGEGEATFKALGIRGFIVTEIGENGTVVLKQKIFVDNEGARIAARSQGFTDKVLYECCVTAVSETEIKFAYKVDKQIARATYKLVGQSLVWVGGSTFAKGEPNPNRR